MKAGDVLHASCSDTDYKVLAVGKDLNGNDCLTIEVEDINDFIDDDSTFGDEPNLMYVEPKAAIFYDVPWRVFCGDTDRVELRTPGTGCYLCTKVFSIVGGGSA